MGFLPEGGVTITAVESIYFGRRMGSVHAEDIVLSVFRPPHPRSWRTLGTTVSRNLQSGHVWLERRFRRRAQV